MKVTPSLATHNRYSVLPVDDDDDVEYTAISDPPRPAVPPKPPIPKLERWERRLPKQFVVSAIAPTSSASSLDLNITIKTTDIGREFNLSALVDSGATGSFIDQAFVEENNIATCPLHRPILISNVDGTPNEGGIIKEIVDLMISYKGHGERCLLAVTNLGKQKIILGYPWLREHNPEIDWQTHEVKLSRCPRRCNTCLKEVRKAKAQTISVIKLRDGLASVLPTIPEAAAEESTSDNASFHLPEDNESLEDDAEEEDEAEKLEEGDRLFVTSFRSGPPPPSKRQNQEVERLMKLRDSRIAYMEQLMGIKQHHVREQRTGDHASYVLCSAELKAEQERGIRAKLPQGLWDFQDVFEKENFDELPEHRQWDHAIELTQEPKQGNTRCIRLNRHDQERLDTFIDTHLKDGRIRPSKSPIAAPFFFVKKKDGDLRPVQDYRYLNSITKKNKYPLPLVDDLIQRLKGAKYFTKLDVRWGYNNVRIREGDEWKAAFLTNRGLFEPLVMFFGLCNSPATFQTMMNDIFADLIGEGKLCVYMDDILIFGQTREEVRRTTREVLKRLRHHKLYLKAEKCEFEKERIEYLGLIISHNSVSMDPKKVKDVVEWPRPEDKRDVQSFLGFANFYRRFIEDFSKIARPLFDLTKKDVEFVWSEACEDAFVGLKRAITSAPVLVLANDRQPFRIKADSSDYATGGVLLQLSEEDDKYHPVAFMSKSLTPVQRNYDVHDKELLAIIRCLEEWRYLLEGARHPVEIWTDHRNLTYFREARDLNRRQARWALYLTRFDYTLEHRPGSSMGEPDALSRRADHGKGEEDNKGVVLLPPDVFAIHAMQATVLRGPEQEILRDIRECFATPGMVDQPVAAAARQLRRDRARGQVRTTEWDELDGLLTFAGRIYVPNDKDLRRRIISQFHDSRITGHPGRAKTLELVSRDYWWPQMSRHIGHYTRSCETCLRSKVIRRRPIGELNPLPVPEGRWEVVSVDFITELPEAHGYDAIMVLVDTVTKRPHFLPTTTTVTAEGAARLYYQNVWKLHGLPLAWIHDRGTQFMANFMKELNKSLGIKMNASTSHHPQTDGQTERVNQELEAYLRKFCNYNQNDWDELLPSAEFAAANAVHASSGMSPFMLDLGRNPRMGFEPNVDMADEDAEAFKNRMAKSLEDARAALAKAKEDQALYYNRRRDRAPDFKVGDKVYLDASDIPTTRPSKKLDNLRYGPYKVLAKVGRGAYRIQLPPTLARLHPVFPVVKLTAAPPDPFPGRQQPPPPPPIQIRGEDEYEVSKILDSRVRWRRVEYLVKYKGYDDNSNEWIPHHAVNAKTLTRRFHRDNPTKPAPED